MTEEKKKRGRPRKINSLQELKEVMDEAMKPLVGNEIQNAELVLPGPIGVVTYQDGTSSEILQTKSDYSKGTLTMTLGPRQESEKLIPPAGLSKIDALKWLTAHKK